eukprot:1190649-Prorocentrum_minimum.AAC.4
MSCLAAHRKHRVCHLLVPGKHELPRVVEQLSDGHKGTVRALHRRAGAKSLHGFFEKLIIPLCGVCTHVQGKSAYKLGLGE